VAQEAVGGGRASLSFSRPRRRGILLMRGKTLVNDRMTVHEYAPLAARARILMVVVAAACALLTCGITHAGDYMFQIANDPSAPCGKGQTPPKPYWTIRSGPQVAAELMDYFTGRNDSSTLVHKFPNGHFQFCGRAERSNVYDALLDAASVSELRHEKDLIAIVPYLASRQFVDAMDHRLAKADMTAVAQTRIRRMRLVAAEALQRLKTR
jgi:hypothetical protein